MIYPVVVPEADATTDGLLLLDLTLEEMVVLDEFEGDGYNRVELRPDQCHACGIPPEPAPSVYIGTDALAARIDESVEWSLDDFRRLHLATYLEEMACQ